MITFQRYQGTKCGALVTAGVNQCGLMGCSAWLNCELTFPVRVIQNVGPDLLQAGKAVNANRLVIQWALC